MEFQTTESPSSEITSYLLEWDQGSHTTEFVECYNGPNKQYDVCGLKPLTAYTFRMSVKNAIGSRYGISCQPHIKVIVRRRLSRNIVLLTSYISFERPTSTDLVIAVLIFWSQDFSYMFLDCNRIAPQRGMS